MWNHPWWDPLRSRLHIVDGKRSLERRSSMNLWNSLWNLSTRCLLGAYWSIPKPGSRIVPSDWVASASQTTIQTYSNFNSSSSLGGIDCRLLWWPSSWESTSLNVESINHIPPLYAYHPPLIRSTCTPQSIARLLFASNSLKWYSLIPWTPQFYCFDPLPGQLT